MEASTVAFRTCSEQVDALATDLYACRFRNGLSEEDAGFLLKLLADARLFLAQDGDDRGQRALLAAYQQPQGDHDATDR